MEMGRFLLEENASTHRIRPRRTRFLRRHADENGQAVGSGSFTIVMLQDAAEAMFTFELARYAADDSASKGPGDGKADE